MASNPTIIAASLSDSELKNSINSLVKHVDDAMKAMVGATNSAVDAMEKKLKSLGDLKIDSGGSADGGASRRAKAQNTEADAVEKTIAVRDKQIKQNKEVEMSFDQMAKAQRQAVSPTPTQAPQIKSARESYLAFVQGFKAQGEAIARQIKDAEAALNKAVENRVNELNTKLANAKAKLNELNAELAKQRMNAERTGNYSTYNAGITRTTQAIEYQMKHIAELQKKISEVSPNMFTQQVQGISALRREQERVANIMKEDVTTRQQSTSATQQQLTAEQKLTDEIHKQAQAIRESKQWKEKGFVTVNGRDIYNFEGSDTPLKNRVTLEEQLLRLQELEKTTSREITEEGAKRLSQEQLELAITGSTKETLQKSRDILRAMVETRQATATFTAQLESANRLNEKLKELRTRYNEMTFGQRMSAEGQEIAKNIRIVTRETQKLQSQLSRPANLKEALGHPEKTLDDIAYKIQQLRAYMRGLDTTNARSASEVRTVTYALEELKKKENDLLGKQAQLFGSNNALARSWNYMKNRLAFYFTVGASTGFIRNLIEVRSQYEMNERALGILINSAERGTRIFNELSQMALVSPYTLIELSAAAKQLTAYDIAAKDVVDTTRRLADMAAAVGVPIERLTYALGQIKAYGYLNSRDNRMFANAGIPLVKQLADYYTELEGRLVSTADVYDRIKKKSVSYEDTMQVINRMTDEGGKFFDFQAKMAETLKVQLANLTLAWNNMLNDIGKESQGILVGGIGALKQMFLHWKDIEHVLNEIIVVFGIYKAAQMTSIALTGTFTKTLDANVLAMKRAEATSLQRAALTRTLTAGEMRLIAAQNSVTASDYRMMLSSKSLTKQQALLMVALNRRNAALAQALIRMGLLTASEIRSMTAGKALSLVWKSMAISIKSAAAAMGSFMASNWVLLLIGGVYEIWHAWDSYGEHVAEVNRSAAEHAKESLKSIKEYMDSDATRQTLSSASKGSLTDMEASKAWETMRDKIEEVSAASSTYIAQLLETEDVSQRLTLGAQYLQDIESARRAMSEIDEDAITLSQTVAEGLLGEGLKDDLKDYESAIDDFAKVDSDATQQSSKRWYDYWKERKEQQEEFANEVKKTTDNIYDVASERGLSVNAQRELFEQALSERAQKEQLSVRGTRLLRIQAEKEYYNYAKTMLEERMKYEDGAQQQRTKNEIAALEVQFNSNKALQESFFAWLSDRHNSEVSKRLGHLTTEEIKAGKWLKGENLKWVKERAQDFTREYGLSFDTLYGYVKKANTWEIHIKTFFDTIGQSLTDVQKDYETRTGRKFKDNPLLKDATSQLDIVKKLQDEEARLTEEYKASEKAGGAYFVTNKVRMESELESLRKQIHQYNALTKAEEKEQNARNKKVGSSSKKDLLGEAIQKNVQYINEIRKAYEDFKKDGLNATDAVEAATKHFGKSLARNNKELAKYGIHGLTGEQFATMNLQQVRDYFQNMINGAQGSAKAVEILEKEVQNIDKELIKFNQKTITDSLNNELSKLKDEYELAVALDADPELGSMFAELWGIDMDALPHTAQEYAKGLTESLNKYLKDAKTGLEIEDVLGLTDDDLGFLDDLLESESITQTAYDLIQKVVKAARDARNKEIKDTISGYEKLLEKYSEYEYKMLQIERNANNERKTFAMKFGNDSQKSKVTGLITNIDIEKDPQKKEQLKEQLKKVLTEIAGSDAAKLQLTVAIDNRELQEGAKLAFEEFKKTPDWIIATGDLAGLTDKALRGLIKRIDDYKKKAKNLDPKQIKEINRALKALHKQVRQGNPFSAIIDVIEQAKERTEEYQPELDSIMSDIVSLEKEIGDNDPTPEQAKHLKTLKDKWEEVKKAQTEAGKVDAMQITGAINDTIQAASQATKVFTDMMDAIAGSGNGASQTLKDITSVLEKGGQGAAIGAQIGGGYGAIIGAAAGVVTGLVSIFAGAGNRRITEAVEESERAVKRLENRVESLKGSYDAMTDTAEHSYGAQSAAATLAASSMKEQEIALKRLMLAETKRQLRLEQSRSSKRRDTEKELALQKEIISQQNEIDSMLRETNRAVEEVVDSLLGISRGSWAEELTDALISAFKAGEDYMNVFEDSWEEMVQNLVVKTIAARVIGDALEKHVLSRIEQIENEQTASYQNGIAAVERAKADWQNLLLDNPSEWANAILKEYPNIVEDLYNSLDARDKEYYQQLVDQQGEEFAKKRLILGDTERAQNALNAMFDGWINETKNAMIPEQQNAQIRALQEVMTEDTKNAMMEDLRQVFPQIMETWGVKFGQDATKELSALQRGIQGITEQQAGALEAITNGMYQQITLQSGILQQINMAVQSFNFDAQLGTTSQILLQLQTTYQNQQAIRSIMEGWTNASGMAVRVEMV